MREMKKMKLQLKKTTIYTLIYSYYNSIKEPSRFLLINRIRVYLQGAKYVLKKIKIRKNPVSRLITSELNTVTKPFF